MARRKNGKGTTTICAHEIEWWYDGQLHPEDYDDRGDPQLPESEEEHIQELLIQNCYAGDLNYIWVDKKDEAHEVSGWWNIQKN